MLKESESRGRRLGNSLLVPFFFCRLRFDLPDFQNKFNRH
ncbi:hypothetical protein LEP1GSC047_0788 [Leptospira inadai serovar Lyme str. 10]|uniref:Uncharacterized protein n=1 Tax=Leptospira inadai serovar Lyme str. 10 TaxID=1049790 RepID=V6HDK1_9LEPT|nr:hypothetical protein LEP1GSC047_0788 [Leptospira inadai serovar Lyme str. 10]